MAEGAHGEESHVGESILEQLEKFLVILLKPGTNPRRGLLSSLSPVSRVRGLLKTEAPLLLDDWSVGFAKNYCDTPRVLLVSREVGLGFEGLDHSVEDIFDVQIRPCSVRFASALVQVSLKHLRKSQGVQHEHQTIEVLEEMVLHEIVFGLDDLPFGVIQVGAER
jgi:hypothetical protein